MTSESESEELDRSGRKAMVFRVVIVGLSFVLAHALLLDAAIETHVSGSPLRWWISGTVGIYAIILALAGWWVGRSHAAAFLKTGSLVGLVLLIALVCCSSLHPAGFSDGVRLLGQNTSTVMLSITLIAIAAFGVLWGLASNTDYRIRIGVGVVALYGFSSFLLGLLAGTPYVELLNGGAFWSAMPHWLQGSLLGALVFLPVALVHQVVKGVLSLRGAALQTWSAQPIGLALCILLAFQGFTYSGSVTSARAPSAVAETMQEIADRDAGTDRPFRQTPEKMSQISNIPPNVSSHGAQTDPRPQLRNVADMIEATLDKRKHDPTALAKSMCGKAAIDIAAEVNHRVATQIYAGALRGGAGALSSGAANAWDQSLLLAGLLRDCGYEVRFAFARLNAEDAARLVNASAPAIRSGAAGDLAGVTGIRDKLLALGASEQDIARFVATLEAPMGRLPLSDEVPRVADNLTRALGDHMPNGAALEARLLAEASNYVWVQARLAGGTKWQDLHTAFVPAGPITSKTVADDLPANARHRIAFSLSIEVIDGDAVERVTVVERRVHTIGQVPRTGILLSISPNTFDGEDLGDLTKATSFLVRIEGDDGEARAFSVGGEVFDAIAGAQAAAKISGAFEGLNSTIGGLSKPKAVKETSGVVLEMTMLAPFDGPQTRIERRLWSKADPKKATPSGAWAIAILAANASSSEIHQTQITEVRAILDGETPLPDNPAALAMLSWIFNEAARSAGGDNSLIYRESPMIAISGLQLAPDKRLFATFDIANSGLLALKKAGDSWKPDPKAAMMAGIAETLAETLLRGGLPSRAEWVSAESAWGVLSASDTYVTVSGDESLAGTGLRGGPLASAKADLDRTSLIAVASGPTAGWWLVDPTTGAVTGIDRHGRGGEFAEFIILLDLNLSMGLMVKSMLECGKNDTGCIVRNMAWSCMTWGGGFVLAKGFGKLIDPKGLYAAVDAATGLFLIFKTGLISFFVDNPL